MGKILITAFEPFGGRTVNASAEVLRLLPDTIGGHETGKVILPVVFRRAAETVMRHPADFIFLLGEVGGRAEVTPELKARNRREARIPDNEGYRPGNGRILEEGPEEYRTSVPVEDIVRRIREEGRQIAVSDDAGAYVCNETFYLAGLGSRVPVAFIHVPAEPDRAPEFADIVRRFIELAAGTDRTAEDD